MRKACDAGSQGDTEQERFSNERRGIAETLRELTVGYVTRNGRPMREDLSTNLEPRKAERRQKRGATTESLVQNSSTKGARPMAKKRLPVTEKRRWCKRKERPTTTEALWSKSGDIA